MRIWKVIDPAKVEKVRDLVKRIEEGTKNNLKVWEDTVPFEFQKYYGNKGFNLCGTISGVVPVNGDNLELSKGWRNTTDRGVIPNGRSKEGKEAWRTIEEGTIQVPFGWVYTAIGVKDNDQGRFTIPRVYESKDGTEVFASLDDKYELDNNPHFEEVTQSYINKKLKGQ